MLLGARCLPLKEHLFRKAQEAFLICFALSWEFWVETDTKESLLYSAGGILDPASSLCFWMFLF